MKQLCEKYELTEAEIKFLDNFSVKLIQDMPDNIRSTLSGNKDSLIYHCNGFLEDILDVTEKELKMHRMATTEKVKRFSIYLADRLYPYVNRN